MPAKILRFLKKTDGAALVEYALIASLIAIAAITAMTTLGGKITDKFKHLHEQIDSAEK